MTIMVIVIGSVDVNDNDNDFFLTPWPASFSLKRWCYIMIMIMLYNDNYGDCYIMIMIMWFLMFSVVLKLVPLTFCDSSAEAKSTFGSRCWGVHGWSAFHHLRPSEMHENAGRSCIAPSKSSWISIGSAGQIQSHWSTWIDGSALTN